MSDAFDDQEFYELMQKYRHSSAPLEAVATFEAVKEFAREMVNKEREACAMLVCPTEEHRKDASWGFLGGEEGVELLDSIASEIRARGSHV